MVEDAGADEQLQVVDLPGKPPRRHIKVGLHQQLAAAGRRPTTVMAEHFRAAEGGEESG